MLHAVFPSVYLKILLEITRVMLPILVMLYMHIPLISKQTFPSNIISLFLDLISGKVIFLPCILMKVRNKSIVNIL